MHTGGPGTTTVAHRVTTEAHADRKFRAPYDPELRPDTVTAMEGTRQVEHRDPYSTGALETFVRSAARDDRTRPAPVRDSTGPGQ